MAVSPHLAPRQGSGGRPGPGPGLGAMWGRPWCMGQGTSQGPHSARWERWATGGGGPITGGRRRESPTLITLTPRGPRAASSGAFAPAGARETPRTPAPAAASQRIAALRPPAPRRPQSHRPPCPSSVTWAHGTDGVGGQVPGCRVGLGEGSLTAGLGLWFQRTAPPAPLPQPAHSRPRETRRRLPGSGRPLWGEWGKRQPGRLLVSARSAPPPPPGARAPAPRAHNYLISLWQGIIESCVSITDVERLGHRGPRALSARLPSTGHYPFSRRNE